MNLNFKLFDMDNVLNELNKVVSIENNYIDFEYGELPLQEIYGNNDGFILNDTDTTANINGTDINPYTVVNPNQSDYIYSYATEVASGEIKEDTLSSSGDDHVVVGSGDNHSMMFFGRLETIHS